MYIFIYEKTRSGLYKGCGSATGYLDLLKLFKSSKILCTKGRIFGKFQFTGLSFLPHSGPDVYLKIGCGSVQNRPNSRLIFLLPLTKRTTSSRLRRGFLPFFGVKAYRIFTRKTNLFGLFREKMKFRQTGTFVNINARPFFHETPHQAFFCEIYTLLTRHLCNFVKAHQILPVHKKRVRLTYFNENLTSDLLS
jgi:hypothetical protein